MVTPRAAIILSLIVAANAAGPSKKVESLTAQAEEQKPAERQVRASSEVVSMAVEPQGEVTRVQRSEPVAAKVQLQSEPVAAKVSMKVEPDGEVSKVQRSEPVASKVQLDAKPVAAKVQLASEPAKATQAEKVAVTQPKIIAATAPDDSGSNKSWKSTFFFFASIVLIVILASMIIARIYSGYNAQKANEASSPESVALKGQKASASAAALQQHLNDSSSTSDSGEKIAMLFDRVRRSLEDLSNEKVESQEGDVAGQGGQTTKPTSTNTL